LPDLKSIEVEANITSHEQAIEDLE
jgi:hypothetical protein